MASVNQPARLVGPKVTAISAPIQGKDGREPALELILPSLKDVPLSSLNLANVHWAKKIK